MAKVKKPKTFPTFGGQGTATQTQTGDFPSNEFAESGQSLMEADKKRVKDPEGVQKELKKTGRNIKKNKDGTFTITYRKSGRSETMSAEKFRRMNQALGVAPGGDVGEIGGEFGESFEDIQESRDLRKEKIGELRKLVKAQRLESENIELLDRLADADPDMTYEEALEFFEDLGQPVPEGLIAVPGAIKAIGTGATTAGALTALGGKVAAAKFVAPAAITAAMLTTLYEMKRNPEISVDMADRGRMVAKENMGIIFDNVQSGAWTPEEGVEAIEAIEMLLAASDAIAKESSEDLIHGTLTDAKSRRTEIRLLMAQMPAQKDKLRQMIIAPQAETPVTSEVVQ